jgi:AcrR family transcriptional regulator
MKSAPVKHPPRDATGTRERLLAAARLRFSRDTFENVGTREIAADAGVDAALVNRYFGSKAKLFAAAIEGVFVIEEHLPEDLGRLGEHLVGVIMDDVDELAQGEFDSLRLLLRAAGSPATSALVSERFHAEFIAPLAKLLRGRDADLRAATIASYVVGLATMKHALGSPAFTPSAQRKVVATVGAAIQSCVGPRT